MKQITCVLALILCLGGCSTKSESQVKDGGWVIEKMSSREVTRGLTEESSVQKINVYLPPSYNNEPKERYPVIYFLHGFGEQPTHIINSRIQLNRLFLEGDVQEFIFVEPNGTSSLGGSFYWNSPVSGNWENYIIKEVVPMIDSKYRTIPKKESRGIAGFSMGGTGAVNLGLSHPELFNAMYTFSPGLLAQGDMDLLIQSWGRNMRYFQSYAAAASPAPSLEYPHGEIPHQTYKDPSEDSRVVKNWYTVFGDLEKKTDSYLAGKEHLSGIKIYVGEWDGYKWIPRGCSEFDRILTEKGIPHTFEIGAASHTMPALFAEKRLVPFFIEHLEGKISP